jgi:hypothetical protein
MADGLTGRTPSLNWESGDLPGAWKSFKTHCDFMFQGPLKKKEADEKDLSWSPIMNKHLTPCHIIIRQSMNHMAELFIIFNIGECTLHNTVIQLI